VFARAREAGRESLREKVGEVARGGVGAGGELSIPCSSVIRSW
jgi:hypothetical protein